ncbi:hypothetical protein H0H92_002972 [Tricholoma furcatifolium]|nr:hypothetical protein H0H92_002972 [Tricholoma furcatifolium]
MLSPLIVPYSNRLTGLQLSITSDILEDLAKVPPHAFEEIVDFRLSVAVGEVLWRSALVEEALKNLEFFRHMKKLRKLLFSDVNSSVAHAVASNVSIPYGQLTHLDLESITFKEPAPLMSVLRSCLSVQTILYPGFRNARFPEFLDEEFLPNVTTAFIFDHTLTCIPIPWANLTTLSLPVRIQLEEAHRILTQASRLESLTMYSYLNYSVTPQRGTILLNNLHTLSISSIDTCLLRNLILPVVRKLHIRYIERTHEEDRQPYPRESPVATVLNFLDQGPPLESLMLGMELDSGYSVSQFEDRTIILPDLQILDKWALAHLLTPRIRELSIRLAHIALEDREEETNESHALEFLEKASRFGISFIRFQDPWNSEPTLLKLCCPIFIPEEHDWILGRLYREYLQPDTCLPEDELRGFLVRSDCSPTLSLHVEQFEECR